MSLTFEREVVKVLLSHGEASIDRRVLVEAVRVAHPAHPRGRSLARRVEYVRRGLPSSSRGESVSISVQNALRLMERRQVVRRNAEAGTVEIPDMARLARYDEWLQLQERGGLTK